jgi:hypothetical protein
MKLLQVYFPWHSFCMKHMNVGRSQEPMDTQLMLLVVFIAGLVLLTGLVVGLVVSLRRPARSRLTRRVEATITHMQVEASSFSSWWTITAEWTDPQSGQRYHFRSPHIKFPPRQRVGEQIIVNFDATKPKYYRMEL